VPRQGGLGHHKNRPYVAWPQEGYTVIKSPYPAPAWGQGHDSTAYDKMILGCVRAMTLWARLLDTVTWAHDKMEWT